MSRIRPLMTDRAVRTAGTACLKNSFLLKQTCLLKALIAYPIEYDWMLYDPIRKYGMFKQAPINAA